MSLFSRGVQRVLARHAEPPLRAWCGIAAGATDRQLISEGVGVTNGRLAMDLALGLGVERRVARHAGSLLELLQIATDMADNLADEERDRAAGHGWTDLYAEIPQEARTALRAWMCSVVVAECAQVHPPAALRVSALLGRMVVGQSLTERATRAGRVAGDQARLLALGLWMGRPTDPRTDGIDTWLGAWGAVWQLERDVVDGVDGAAQRLQRAVDHAAAVWPAGRPFDRAFHADRLLASARRRQGGRKRAEHRHHRQRTARGLAGRDDGPADAAL